MVVDLILTISVITLNVKPALSNKAFRNVFCVSAVQCSSHQLHVSTEYLNVPGAIEKLSFKFYSV